MNNNNSLNGDSASEFDQAGEADKRKQGRKATLDFRKYTKQIWLAGLGAFSRAEGEGGKIFDSLVRLVKS